jgi:hypothetical protein
LADNAPDQHEIAEILLKVALNTITLTRTNKIEDIFFNCSILLSKNNGKYLINKNVSSLMRF